MVQGLTFSYIASHLHGFQCGGFPATTWFNGNCEHKGCASNFLHFAQSGKIIVENAGIHWFSVDNSP